MREIIFRGKRIENNEWVYGYYHVLTDTLANTVEHCILQEYRHTSDVVAPETVGQYTGLKDKNGKQIFEGDILLWKYLSSSTGENMLVDYEEKFAEFVVKFKGREHGIWNEFCKTVEVIGNIHDNPELLQA